MSLAKFLKDGNLTDFLKGDGFLSPSSTRLSTRSQSASTSRSASPVREKENEVSEFMEEVKKKSRNREILKRKKLGTKKIKRN